MSRVGKLPVIIPPNVTITVSPESISVTGPKGSLNQFSMPGITVEVKDGQAIVSRESDSKEHRSKHGLMRSLINNMVIGVSEGVTKQLELNGVGFRVASEGNRLKLSLGFSHEIIYPIPEGVSVSVEQNIITVNGASKQQVGQVAAEIRSLKKPEPYKGKGLKYVGERIIRKSGKSGKEK